MPSAAILRRHIEQELEVRFPGALSPATRTASEVAATGIEEADRLLEGGLPLGTISEISGPASSGRTSLAMAFVAQRTAEGRVCAWVDVGDTLDPESAAASGVNLKQLLWVRCRDGGVLQRSKSGDKPWTRLDQALRATDLLLQGGGFGAVVLDLGDLAPEHGARIPLATWFRFRQAADRTRCCVVVLGRTSYAQSSAAVVMECAPLGAETAGETVLTGFAYQLRRGRQRFASQNVGGRKPPASTWSASAAWSGEKGA